MSIFKIVSMHEYFFYDVKNANKNTGKILYSLTKILQFVVVVLFFLFLVEFIIIFSSFAVKYRDRDETIASRDTDRAADQLELLRVSLPEYGLDKWFQLIHIRNG